jgi:hypothetical protein
MFREPGAGCGLIDKSGESFDSSAARPRMNGRASQVPAINMLSVF